MVEKTERTPQPGEYWDIGKDRVLIIGSNGPLTVFQTRDGRYNDESTEYAVETWGLLPDCTGWDWQPKPPQEYFDLTAMDGHVLRTGIDNCRLSGTGWAFISMLGGITVGAAKKSGWVEFRCRIEHAPKTHAGYYKSIDDDMGGTYHVATDETVTLTYPDGRVSQLDKSALQSLLNASRFVRISDAEAAERMKPPQPAESPDDWVTQDRVPIRSCDQWRFTHWTPDVWSNGGNDKPLSVSVATHGVRLPGHGNSTLELRCKRKDLPPIEPKPSPQMQTFHEVIRDVHDDSDRWGNWQLVCVTHPKPTDIRTGRTETREVSR